ncbi:hypothetical protein QUC31_010130, partial [Theobroma cacao]
LLEGSKRVLYLEGDQLKKEIEQVSDAMAVLEGMMKGKKFFGGETVGFLDIAFGWTTVWLEAIEEVAGVEFFNRDKYPHLDNWKNEFKEIHAVKDSLFPMESARSSSIWSSRSSAFQEELGTPSNESSGIPLRKRPRSG